MSDDVPTNQPTVTLPGGVALPLLGLGTWQATGEDAYRAVRVALEAGYRHIDTAAAYGNEAQVGRALADSGLPREEVFVTTKLRPSDADRAPQAINDSLAKLGLDYVDLWLIHWPIEGQASPPTWQHLRDARDAGLTRAIGVSNYSLDQLDELADASGEIPSVNQIPWGPTRNDPTLLAGHQARGVVLEGYSPLRNADLDSPVLKEIAEAHGVTPAQVALRWHIDHGVVVIPKSTREERIRANGDLFGFALSADELARVDALDQP
ncbi:aldo/keto reductase [Luedemannella helvata]|uniref:Aldo/keto reductase n=1 Tax=Luedemannella helvata TaxID=349315 RepID=A0ABN2KTH7_9ACTN